MSKYRYNDDEQGRTDEHVCQVFGIESTAYAPQGVAD